MSAAVVWSVAGGSLVLTAWSIFGELRRVRQHEKVSSRFPMFEARDELIRLVLDGKVAEDNELWVSSYRAANSFLSLQRRLDLWDFLKDFVRHSMELQDESRRREFEDFKKDMQSLGRSVPEYEAAIERMDRALWRMVMVRTSRAGLLAILLGLVALYAVAKLWSAGSKVLSLRLLRKGASNLFAVLRTVGRSQPAQSIAGVSMFYLIK